MSEQKTPAEQTEFEVEISDSTLTKNEAENDAAPTVGVVEESPSASKTESVARSAGIVSIAVMFSRVLGLVREMVNSRLFGAGFLFDAYQVAFTIPNVLRDLFAEGALSAAFVKTFTDYQFKKSEEEAWRLASLVLNALIIVLSVITIIGILLSPWIVAWIAPKFGAEKAELTVLMTQIMFPFILLVAMAALAMGVLNTKGVFGIPASASTAFNIVSIISGVALAFWLSGGSWEGTMSKDAVPSDAAQRAIIGMAIGTLIGGAAQFLLQVPALLRVGFRFRPQVSFRDEGVRRVMSLMAPAILGTSAVQINVLVNTYFVTGIEGGRSWLSYSFRLMQFPIGVFGVAIGTAAIPTLSRLATQNDIKGFRDTLVSSLNLVFLLTLPSAVGLMVLGEPIIRLIYEGSRFNSAATEMTAYALAGYALGLTGYAAIKILSPSFYALGDARTPMYVSLFSIVVNGIACYFFREILKNFHVSEQFPNGLGHVGVTLATSSVALVNFFALVILMKRKIGEIRGAEIFNSFMRIFGASVIMGIGAYLAFYVLKSQFGTSGIFRQMIETFVPIAIGGILFIASAKIFGVKDLNRVFDIFARRFRRKTA